MSLPLQEYHIPIVTKQQGKKLKIKERNLFLNPNTRIHIHKFLWILVNFQGQTSVSASMAYTDFAYSPWLVSLAIH